MGFGQNLVGKGWEEHNKKFKINTCRSEMFPKTRCIDSVETLEKSEQISRSLEEKYLQ